MNNQVYSIFQNAKKRRDLVTMEKLYISNNTDKYIKYEYAKLLNLYGRKNEAKILFSELASEDNCFAKFELGKIEFDLGNIDLARKIFHELLCTKNHLYAKFELGKLETSVGNINYARRLFNSILSYKKDIFTMLELGKLELSVGDFKKARFLFEDILRTKDDSYAKFELGKLEVIEGNYMIAHKYFTELLTCQNREYAELELGKLEYLLGNVDKAKMHFNNLLNTSNKNGALLELGTIEYYQGNLIDAFKCFDKVLHTKSEEYVLPSLINMLIKEGYVREAFEYFMYSKRKNYYCDPKAELYLMKYLNIYFNKPEDIIYSYNNMQLIDYDEFVAIEHIVEKHSDEFSKNIDIYSLFKTISEKICDKYYVGKLVLNDIYDIPYKGIGISDTLRVIVIPGTKNILSMYPLIDKEIYDDEESFGVKK